jgi:hypothetical protein
MPPDPAQPMIDLPLRIAEESASLMAQIAPAAAGVLLIFTLVFLSLNLLRKAT